MGDLRRAWASEDKVTRVRAVIREWREKAQRERRDLQLRYSLMPPGNSDKLRSAVMESLEKCADEIETVIAGPEGVDAD